MSLDGALRNDQLACIDGLPVTKENSLIVTGHA
jgi:hypothetical protein